jgi:hypothetical protein
MHYSAIKAAEQWTVGSVAMTLLLVALGVLWYLRAGRKP